jgi:hypothetical protein
MIIEIPRTGVFRGVHEGHLTQVTEGHSSRNTISFHPFVRARGNCQASDSSPSVGLPRQPPSLQTQHHNENAREQGSPLRRAVRPSLDLRLVGQPLPRHRAGSARCSLEPQCTMARLATALLLGAALAATAAGARKTSKKAIKAALPCCEQPCTAVQTTDLKYGIGLWNCPLLFSTHWRSLGALDPVRRRSSHASGAGSGCARACCGANRLAEQRAERLPKAPLGSEPPRPCESGAASPPPPTLPLATRLLLTRQESR